MDKWNIRANRALVNMIQFYVSLELNNDFFRIEIIC